MRVNLVVNGGGRMRDEEQGGSGKDVLVERLRPTQM